MGIYNSPMYLYVPIFRTERQLSSLRLRSDGMIRVSLHSKKTGKIWICTSSKLEGGSYSQLSKSWVFLGIWHPTVHALETDEVTTKRLMRIPRCGRGSPARHFDVEHPILDISQAKWYRHLSITTRFHQGGLWNTYYCLSVVIFVGGRNNRRSGLTYSSLESIRAAAAF